MSGGRGRLARSKEAGCKLSLNNWDLVDCEPRRTSLESNKGLTQTGYDNLGHQSCVWQFKQRLLARWARKLGPVHCFRQAAGFPPTAAMLKNPEGLSCFLLARTMTAICSSSLTGLKP